MKIFLRLTVLILFAVLTITGCERDGGPQGLDPEVYENLEKYYGVHPRLILPEGADTTLRAELESTHRWLWRRFLQDLPSMVERSRSPDENLSRGEGNLAAELAFAWRATGADSLRDIALDYLLTMSRRDTWDPEYDLLHGHLLLGAALAYDWLYPEMNRAQRQVVARKLGDEAHAQYEQIVEHRAWYRNQYLQNHAHVNYAGIAFAGAALYGEDARAQQWLAACEDFFPEVFRLSPADGGSIEGLSYGNYAMEFCLFYAELARTVLGRNYYDSAWIENFPRYELHSLLPDPAEDQWAMAFGDSPRHGNSHGPEHQLFLIASRLNDPAAQWLGRRLIDLRERGLGSASWWAIAWYEPDVGRASPENFSTLHRFSEIGQVMARTSWTDTSAALLGFKAGAWLAEANADSATHDLGAAHAQPDAGSFQFFTGGRFVLIDPGYTHFKRTGNHNTLLIKGAGQLGGLEPWFAGAEALEYGHHPRIIETLSTTDFDYMLADLAPAYHPALKVDRALRHVLFIKPDILLVADELSLGETGALLQWPADSLRLSGMLNLEGGYAVGSGGEAAVEFDGPAGLYTVGVSYLDNAPGAGSYQLLVDGRTVHSWRNETEVTDTHLELVPELELEPGNEIAAKADPMGRGGRIVKITAAGSDIPAQRSATWLLHFDPEVTLQRNYTWIEADLGDITVDIHPLAPARRSHSWGIYPVLRGSEYDSTMRLEIEPSFSDSTVTMLNLLYVRPSESRPLEWLRAGIIGRTATVRYYRERVQYVVTLDLESHEVTLRRPQ